MAEKYEGVGGPPPSQSKGIWNGGEELITIMMGKRSIGHGTQVFHLQLPSAVGKSGMHSAPVNLDLTSGKRIPILFGIFAKNLEE